MLTFNEETSRKVESTYTTQDVIAQRARVLDALAPKPGERILDLGVGPGFLASEIAGVVGSSGSVCGVDISESMLALAERRRTANMELGPGSATEIPYPDGEFDAVVSAQVLEYVADIPAALAEARRVLRPGGRLVVLDTDWDSIVWRTNEPGLTDRVLVAWAEHLADPHLPRRLVGELRAAGFEVAAPDVMPLLNAGWAEQTYSAGLTEIIAAFVVGRNGLTGADVDRWRADVRGLGSDAFFSLNRYLFCARKPMVR